MKCIKLNGKILRVPDEDAARLVKSGAVYVPKSEWRKARAK